MQSLAPTRWPQYLQRIAERYQGQLVTLRQREPSGDEAHVALWRTPLRSLSVLMQLEQTVATVEVGEDDAPIRFEIRDVQEILVVVSADGMLERVHFRNADGGSATLLLNVHSQ